MEQPEITRAAGTLLRAYDEGPVDAPSKTFPGMTVGDAYEVQLEQVRSWTSAGARVRGHKVGLTSAAVQRMLGVDSPDFGHLLDTMFWSDHQPVPLDCAFSPTWSPRSPSSRAPAGGSGGDRGRRGQGRRPRATGAGVVDSRVSDWKITLCDTVADNASSWGVVLGGSPRLLACVDLRLTGCNLRLNGRVAATGAGGAVLGDPLNALVWIANVLGGRGGALEAGQEVLPGACTTMIPFAVGDTVTADFAGLGSVTATSRRTGPG